MISSLANGTSRFQVTSTGLTAINKEYLDLDHTTLIRVDHIFLHIYIPGDHTAETEPWTSSVLLSSCLPLNINGWRAQVNQYPMVSWLISLDFLFRFLYSTTEVDYSRNWVPLIQPSRKELNKAGIYTVITPFQTIIHFKCEMGFIILRFALLSTQATSLISQFLPLQHKCELTTDHERWRSTPRLYASLDRFSIQKVSCSCFHSETHLYL